MSLKLLSEKQWQEDAEELGLTKVEKPYEPPKDKPEIPIKCLGIELGKWYTTFVVGKVSLEGTNREVGLRRVSVLYERRGYTGVKARYRPYDPRLENFLFPNMTGRSFFWNLFKVSFFSLGLGGAFLAIVSFLCWLDRFFH